MLNIKRFDRLKNLVENQFEENNKKYIGTIEKVLIEGFSKNNDKTLTARTDSNKVIIIEAGKEMIGQVVNVKIVSEHKWYLKGVLFKLQKGWGFLQFLRKEFSIIWKI